MHKYQFILRHFLIKSKTNTIKLIHLPMKRPSVYTCYNSMLTWSKWYFKYIKSDPRHCFFETTCGWERDWEGQGQWRHQGAGGIEAFAPPVGGSAPHLEEKKWSKSAIFCNFGFCPLRNAFCPLDAPPPKKNLVPPLVKVLSNCEFSEYFSSNIQKILPKFRFQVIKQNMDEMQHRQKKNPNEAAPPIHKKIEVTSFEF